MTVSNSSLCLPFPFRKFKKDKKSSMLCPSDAVSHEAHDDKREACIQREKISTWCNVRVIKDLHEQRAATFVQSTYAKGVYRSVFAEVKAKFSKHRGGEKWFSWHGSRAWRGICWTGSRNPGDQTWLLGES